MGPIRRGNPRFQAPSTNSPTVSDVTHGPQARDHHEALQAARRAQTTEEFRSRYAARAGIEGTHEQAIRRCGLRQCRYIGQAKAHLQHVLTAVAVNIVRLSDWWWAGTAVARTRCSRFAALQPAA
jgi:Transposase DDE domain